MKEYLVFRLYGPMASWGLAAVGGDRHTGASPTRSAIVGLLGAALGIKRDQEKQLQALQDSVLIAVKECVPSVALRDYHTTQVPSHSNKLQHRTRKSELAEEKLNTILSRRDYRCDGLWVIAVSLTPASAFTLQQMQHALEHPVYVLSLGRKSCPLALPLSAQIVSHETIREALDTAFPPITRSHHEDQRWLNSNARVTYYWEGDKNEIDHPSVLTTEPWDQPLSRSRWQFTQRTMHQLSIEEAANVSF